MNNTFYDPSKTFDENVDNGPFFDTIPETKRSGDPKHKFLGFPIYQPFGIGAGTLPTSKHVNSAFAWGYDVVCYKTMRSVPYQSNPFPNIVPIDVEGDVTLEQADNGLTMAEDYPKDQTKIVITNSFGNPGRGPEYWQPDMRKVTPAEGQVMIASVFGTPKDGGGNEDFWQDFADTAVLAVDSGAPIIELNLSCPNVVGEGIVCYTPEAVFGIVERTRKAIGNTPLVIKLGYFRPEQQSLFEQIIEGVSDKIQAVSLINTITAKVYKKDGSQALPGEGRLVSGLCGAGIKWAGIDMVKRLDVLRQKNGYDLEIIGIGGVMQPSDYVDYRNVGADVVQACTAPMWNTDLANEISTL